MNSVSASYWILHQPGDNLLFLQEFIFKKPGPPPKKNKDKNHTPCHSLTKIAIEFYSLLNNAVALSAYPLPNWTGKGFTYVSCIDKEDRFEEVE